MKITTLVMLGALFCHDAKAVDKFDAAALVRQFSPAELATHPIEEFGTPPGVMKSAYATSTFDDDSPHIVAAYTNANEAYVRLLSFGDEGWHVQRAWHIAELATSPKVELRDLDADGISEVVVGVGVGPKSEERDFLFRWADGNLRSIPQVDTDGEAPHSDDAEPASSLGIADYVDIDGDGKLEIIGETVARTDETEAETDFPYRSIYTIYPYVEGRLGPRRFLTAYFTLAAPKKSDTVSAEEFSTEDLAAKYELRLIHRGARGNWYASGATVRLNGVVVANAKDFKERDVVIIPVVLQAHNRLEIAILDAPSGTGTPPNASKESVLVTALVESR
jgi:hypothetical protein